MSHNQKMNELPKTHKIYITRLYKRLFGKVPEPDTSLDFVRRKMGKINSIIGTVKSETTRQGYLNAFNYVIERKQGKSPKSNNPNRFIEYRKNREPDADRELAQNAYRYICKLNKKDDRTKKNSLSAPSELCEKRYKLYQVKGKSEWRSHVYENYCLMNDVCRQGHSKYLTE